ncbi:hypothetical protein BKA70DRAFT_1223452 [Coprinopsis sp. MPI-PUGE-AT-0042]|nr:hypothetical protein BKA70DRAFT_1223452 [Coprinopsis sp. MPI-PUGE-AT-0042]
MPFCTLAYVTVNRHHTYYRWALKLGLLDRFVDAGDSEKGMWAQVKAKVKPLIPEHGRKPSAAGESDCDMGVEDGISGSSDESDSDICMMESMRLNIFEMVCNAKTLFNIDVASLNKGTFTARALYSYDRKFVFPVKSGRKFHEVVFMEVEYPPEESSNGASISQLLAAKKLRVPRAPLTDWSVEDATWVEAYRMYSVRLMVNAFVNDAPNSDGASPQLIDLEVLQTFYLEGKEDWYACAQEYLGSMDVLSGQRASVQMVSPNTASNSTPAAVRNLLAACSHHAHYYSSGDFVITDWQAAFFPLSLRLKVYDCTVHAIDKADPRSDGFVGNRFQEGIDAFLQEHRCNEICKALRLPRLHGRRRHVAACSPLGTPAAARYVSVAMQFSFKRRLRSSGGAAFEAQPVVSPPVELSELLQRAVVFDSDDMMEPEVSGAKRRLSETLVSGTSSGEVAGDEVEDGECKGELEEGEVSADDDALSTKRSRRSLYRAKLKDAEVLASGHHPKPEQVRKQAQEHLAIKASANLSSLPSSSCGYRAYTKKAPVTRKTPELDELLQKGYRLVEWDGRTTKPIVDSKTDKVFAVLVAAPNDPTYRSACAKVADVLESHGRSGKFTNEELRHKCGTFPAVNVGISYGQGSVKPGNLRNKDPRMVAALLANVHIQRVAVFASYALSMWFPNFYSYAKEHLDSLYATVPGLSRNFLRSVYPRAAFNLGPGVCTLPHLDVMNCPFGLCSIQAFGDFDYKKGGHLVLADLKLVIEFPPGSLILMPSATLQHANTPTEASLKKSDPDLYAKNMELKKGRWEMGLGLWNSLDELVEQVERSQPKAC